MKKTKIVFIVLLVILSLIGCTANKDQNALNGNIDTKARKVG
jgi:PBP1b-binding outer membrane lipoprotein LpoB